MCVFKSAFQSIQTEELPVSGSGLCESVCFVCVCVCHAVAKALDTADPIKKAALTTFYSAHDNLVVSRHTQTHNKHTHTHTHRERERERHARLPEQGKGSTSLFL